MRNFVGRSGMVMYVQDPELWRVLPTAHVRGRVWQWWDQLLPHTLDHMVLGAPGAPGPGTGT